MNLVNIELPFIKYKRRKINNSYAIILLTLDSIEKDNESYDL